MDVLRCNQRVRELTKNKEDDMEIKKAAKTKKDAEAKGYILFGNIGTKEEWNWFERWYATEEAALKYANKRGWVIE